ncbi:MAG: TIGR02206 family membrane protein [Anaerofustis stercorihominis]|nr:TIGR02206 family membrane protein [Anaerofustis stercorihominis]
MFRYFLETMETIPEGLGFTHYGPIHIAWLAIAAISTAVLCVTYKKQSAEKRLKYRKIFAWSIVANDIFETVCLLIGGRYTLDYLPLHLCSINVFVILHHAYYNKELENQMLYALCMPGALVALLFPMWWTLPVVNFSHIHSFTVHIQLFAYPVMLLYAGDIKPDMKMLPKCAGALLAIAPFIYIFNMIAGTNFMFINRPQENSPLEIMGEVMGNPGYLVGFAALIFVVWILMFLPFEIISKKKKKTA